MGHRVCTMPNKANRVPSKSLKQALYIVQNVTQWTALWNQHQLQIPKLSLKLWFPLPRYQLQMGQSFLSSHDFRFLAIYYRRASGRYKCHHLPLFHFELLLSSQSHQDWQTMQHQNWAWTERMEVDTIPQQILQDLESTFAFGSVDTPLRRP